MIDTVISFFSEITSVQRGSILAMGLMFFWILEGFLPFRILKYNKLRYIGSSLAERQYIHISDATEATLSILKKKYENKLETIKGKKNIKVKKLLSYLKNKLNIKKNIRFDNKKFSGHYIKFPKKYSINLGQNFKFNKNKDIFQELDKLILMTQNELQKK